MKITEAEAVEIFRAVQYGDRRECIAKNFGVNVKTVSNIATGKCWGYVTGMKESPTIEQLSEGCEVRQIPFMPSYYLTATGKVISNDRGKLSILKTRINRSGYESLVIGKGRLNKTFEIHRLLGLVFKPEGYTPSGEVRHLDGNPLNNDLSNLEWGTAQENAADKIRHGTSNRGERHGISKLKSHQVAEIKRLSKESGISGAELARRFGVAPMTISRILRGLIWVDQDTDLLTEQRNMFGE